jgi:hypothetical protein
MMQSIKVKSCFWALCLAPVLWLSCSNPFAPPIGDPLSLWTDQTTVGGLLENFRMSYVRQDSLRYAECLACPDFIFNYFDEDLGDYAWMPREIDLATTGRLFQHYSQVDLRWFGLDPDAALISTPDSLVRLAVFFELVLDNDIITGNARFTMIRRTEIVEDCESALYRDEPVFRLLQWDDEL